MRDAQLTRCFLKSKSATFGGLISTARPTSQQNLSEILEAQVPQRFFLSARAARGILRRAEKRGRTLPCHLQAALESLAQADGWKTTGTSSPEHSSPTVNATGTPCPLNKPSRRDTSFLTHSDVRRAQVGTTRMEKLSSSKMSAAGETSGKTELESAKEGHVTASPKLTGTQSLLPRTSEENCAQARLPLNSAPEEESREADTQPSASMPLVQCEEDRTTTTRKETILSVRRLTP